MKQRLKVKIDTEVLTRLVAGGMSIKELTRHFLVDVATIRSRLKVLGLKVQKNNEGRPLFNGKDYNEVILKLEQVWGIGGSDAEAALFAGISKTSLCEFLKANPPVAERKEELKNTPILAARQEVVKGIRSNPEFSLKFLERRKSDEFAPRQKIDHSGMIDQGFNVPPEDEERYKKEIDNLRKGATPK